MNQRGRLLAVDQGDASACRQAARRDLSPRQGSNGQLFRLGYCHDLGEVIQRRTIGTREASGDLLAVLGL